MKKLLCFILAFSLLFGCTAMAEKAPDKDIVILFTSDVHCGTSSGFGYAGLASIRDHLLAEGNYVTLADCGDAIQGEAIGTLSKGAYLIDIMNSVGYDVAIPGNHEFDYGMENFLSLAEKADFPYISCNFTDLRSNATVFDPYKLFTYGDVKVAFIGICTPKTITSSTPAYFEDADGNFIYGFQQDTDGTALYTAVQNAVNAAHAEGADYVVALAHLGIEEKCSPWMSSEVITHTTGIDALLDGHSHSVIEENYVKNAEGKQVLQVACGTKFAYIGQLRISADGTLSSSLYQWNSAVEKTVSDITSQFDELVNQVIAASSVDLEINEPGTTPAVRIVRCAETNLGDLCADAYRVLSGADVAFVNGGGVRATLPAGDITYGDILRVCPFGNALCVVEATGQQILDALEMASRFVPKESGGFLQVSGMKYEIHTYIPSSVQLTQDGFFDGVSGEYRVKNVYIGDEPLDLAKTYTVASHDYILKNGGDGLSMFRDDPLLQDCVMLDNQAVIAYITQTLHGVVGDQYADPHGSDRIIAVEE